MLGKKDMQEVSINAKSIRNFIINIASEAAQEE